MHNEEATLSPSPSRVVFSCLRTKATNYYDDQCYLNLTPLNLQQLKPMSVIYTTKHYDWPWEMH